MTDALNIKLPRRSVLRNAVDNLYYIYELDIDQVWRQLDGERGFKHSTSCYARLGRLTSKAAYDL